MKRFAILREMDPAITREEINVAALDAIINLGVGEHRGKTNWARTEGVSWIRSYWAPGTTWGLCLYGADDIVDVEHYHELCSVPYVSITEIVEAIPPDAPPKADVDAIEGRSFLVAIEAPTDEIAQAILVWPSSAGKWIRTYLDHEPGKSLATFGLPDSEAFESAVNELPAGWVAHRVVEITPEEYL